MKVAIAGANSGVGRHIAEAVLSHGKHSLTVLARRPSPDLVSLGAHVEVVDYLPNSPSLAPALKGVHTLISALGMHDPEKLSRAELALIDAADKAGVKRFVPSAWAGTNGGDKDVVEVFAKYKEPSLDALKKTRMEWSIPQPGVFMNYFASPKKGLGYLRPGKFWVDVEKCEARIPGDGNLGLVFTAAEDVGEFMARALDVERWPRDLRIVGSVVSLNEIVEIVRRVRGKFFPVSYQSREELQDTLKPDPPSIFTNLDAQFRLALLDQRFTFQPTLDDQVSMTFIQPEEFIQRWWGNDI